MQKRTLGASLETTAMGLGCMSRTSVYGPAGYTDEMFGVIRHAAEKGVTFFDTAESYGPFSNETLLGKALEPVRDECAATW